MEKHGAQQKGIIHGRGCIYMLCKHLAGRDLEGFTLIKGQITEINRGATPWIRKWSAVIKSMNLARKKQMNVWIITVLNQHFKPKLDQSV